MEWPSGIQRMTTKGSGQNGRSPSLSSYIEKCDSPSTGNRFSEDDVAVPVAVHAADNDLTSSEASSCSAAMTRRSVRSVIAYDGVSIAVEAAEQHEEAHRAPSGKDRSALELKLVDCHEIAPFLRSLEFP